MRISKLLSAALLFAACFSLNGCIVAGASSGGGWFIFPGGIGLVIILILFLVLRRR